MLSLEEVGLGRGLQGEDGVGICEEPVKPFSGGTEQAVRGRTPDL